ncbi:MAG: LysR family transcriptional regulator [Cardiobacteriaceae bacterium]|nr:LysR family transcriptional regulator [Cardiobacteriaceae bacterium]
MPQFPHKRSISERAITLEQLRSFVAIADCGNVSQAAAALSRTQSTLSAALKRLEDELGQALIERRQGHVLGLTATGRRFLPTARDILTRMAHACEHLQSEPLAGHIRLGIPDDFDLLRLHDIIAQCLAEHPALRVEITAAGSATLRALAHQGALDISICKTLAGVAVNPESERILRHDNLCWASAHHIDPKTLPSLPLVTFPQGCIIRECAVRALNSIDRPWHPAYTSASFANVRDAVLAGLGIALLPQHALHPALRLFDHGNGFPDTPAIQWVLNIHGASTPARHFSRLLGEKLIHAF